MVDLIVFLILCLLVQIAIMRIWLNSELFSAIQDKLIYWRETKKGVVHYVCYLLTCWQCLGVWVSWGVVFPMAIYLPDTPIKADSYFVLIVAGLAIGLVSEIIEYYFLADMDMPTTRVYDNVHLELDRDNWVVKDFDADELVDKIFGSDASVINNQEEKENESTGVGEEASEESESGSLDDDSGDSGSTV